MKIPISGSLIWSCFGPRVYYKRNILSKTKLRIVKSTLKETDLKGARSVRIDETLWYLNIKYSNCSTEKLSLSEVQLYIGMPRGNPISSSRTWKLRRQLLLLGRSNLYPDLNLGKS